MIALCGVFAVVYPLFQHYVGRDPLAEAQIAPKSVSLKHFLVFKGKFKFKYINLICFILVRHTNNITKDKTIPSSVTIEVK
jgi:glycerol-3-phosphate acyltransferase PlsY